MNSPGGLSNGGTALRTSKFYISKILRYKISSVLSNIEIQIHTTRLSLSYHASNPISLFHSLDIILERMHAHKQNMRIGFSNYLTK